MRSPAVKTTGPSVLRFKADIVAGSEGATASSTVFNVPTIVGKKLGSMETVEGTINGHPFRAALERDAAGSRYVRVNRAMSAGARARAGDTVELAILGPEPEPVMPADLRTAMAASREAKALWNDLTSLGRHDWIRWIESAKKPETRARRVTRTVEQLSSGKRRPCCVNVYEFMLNRVR